jgi:general secretion pathway protein A
MTEPTLLSRMRSAFGFRSLPFGKPDEDRLDFEHLDYARGRLEYLLDRQGIGLLVGPPGVGKSTLLRGFLQGLNRAVYSIAALQHTTCATLDLCREIAHALQLTPSIHKAVVVRQIRERLRKLSAEQKIRPVLVIDDGHLVPPGFYDELRLLAGFDDEAREHLTLILSGQPQLETILRLAVNEAFAQRIALRIRLRPLSHEEVQRYLNLRLEQAGRTAPLFLPEAIEALALGARGLPRLVDRIAEHSLLAALQERKNQIDSAIVNRAIEEVDP